MVRRELARIYGVPTDEWVHLHTAEVPARCPPSPRRARCAATSRSATGCSWLGDHRDTPSQQGALVSGRRAAQAVLAHLGA